MQLLNHNQHSIVRETLECFSNICAGSVKLTDHVVGNAKLLTTILTLF